MVKVKEKRKPARNRGAKGGQFERDTCRRLTLWWTGDPDRDVIFWRTSQSGGRVTTRRKSGRASTHAHAGDITAIDPLGAPLTNLITFELKCGYRHANLHDILDRTELNAATIYEEWIAQAQAASKEAGTPYWAVVHHRRGRETILTIPRRLWRALDRTLLSLDGPALFLETDSISALSCHWEGFLSAITPEEICRLSHCHER